VRLIGFQQVGVAPSILDPWCDLVPDGVSIHALRYPDFNAVGDLSAMSFDRFIDGLVKALAPLAGQPMVFVGGCFGGILAYETACRMADQPVGMVFIGSGAPSLDGPAPTYHLMDDDQLKHELVRMKSMPEQFLGNDDFLAPVFIALRGMSQLATSYRPKLEVLRGCDLTSIWPRFDVTLGKRDMIAWSDMTNGRFSFAEIDGEHAVLMDDPLGVYEVSGLDTLLRTLVSTDPKA
jgi:surfactin synthase thioesterase subunit